jgi:hypothetical protein
LTKKKSHEEEIERGLEELRRLGVAVDDFSPALVPSLRERLGKGRHVDLAVAFALGKIADATAVEALADLGKATSDKELHREIRRSLYKLAQKGLQPPAAESTERSFPRPLLDLAPAIEGYCSSVDGAGGRLLWIAKPESGRGVQLLQGMVSDRIGLVQVGGALVRRKELRQMAQEIKKNHDITMVSIPWEYADQILYEGFERAKASGRGELEQFLSLRAIFNPAKPKSLPHPIYGRLDAEQSHSGAWRELSRRLLDEPEFRTWILDEDLVKPYLAQVEEAQQSRLVLNQLQKEERFAAIVRDAVREIFFGASRAIFQRRLEDMAYYLLETRRQEQAKLALAIAVELGKEEPGPLDISFLTGWMQKSLAFYLGQTKQKAVEEPSLIVKP